MTETISASGVAPRRPEPPSEEERRIERRRWITLSVVLIGTFMVILDTTIVSVALDPIGKDLGSVTGVEWIVTAYLLAVGVVQPATGWLADRFGRKPVFTLSVALFATGSLMCALAPSLGLLIFFRVLQGLAGGAMMPVGMAILYEEFPSDRRGAAFGVWGIAAMAAPAIGPTLGGWLTTTVSWRLLFVINVPVGIVGTIGAVMLLRNGGFQERRPFDWPGILLAGTGVTAILLALSEGGSWGWKSPKTLVTLTLGVLLLAAFVDWALRRTKFPLIDLRVYANWIFSLTVSIICLLTLSQFGRLVFMPLELESLRHYSALHAGLVLTPTAFGAAITMPIGGKLADRIGARIPVTLGLVIVAVATWFLGQLTPTTPDSVIGAWLFVSGFGFGIAMMPNTVVGLNSVRAPLIAQASAVRQLSRQIAGAVAVAALTAVVEGYLGGHLAFNGSHSVDHVQAAYNAVFIWGFWALVLTIVMALFLPGKRGSLELQAIRASEAEALATEATTGVAAASGAPASEGEPAVGFAGNPGT